LEHESHHHHHPHKTGVRWLDLALGISAAVVSLVSLWLALHSAHSMEKLVAANSYPYVETGRSNRTLERDPASGNYRRTIDYQLTNNGVGPARIEWVRLEFKGKPMADLGALLDACCKLPNYDTGGLNQRGVVSGTLIPQGREFHMFTWEAPLTPNPTFDALHRQMNDIRVSTCYCSVFDECYVREWSSEKPKQVEQCTVPPARFEPRVERS
jgi:hypothetical protein